MNQFFNDLPVRKTPPEQAPIATQKASSELYNRYAGNAAGDTTPPPSQNQVVQAAQNVSAQTPAIAPRNANANTPVRDTHHTNLTGMFANVPSSNIPSVQAHASGVQVPRPAPAAPSTPAAQFAQVSSPTAQPTAQAAVQNATVPAPTNNATPAQGLQGVKVGPMGPTTEPNPHPTAASNDVQNYSAVPIANNANNAFASAEPSAVVPSAPAASVDTAVIIPDEGVVPADVVDEMFETEDVNNPSAKSGSADPTTAQYIPLHAGRSVARQRFAFLLKVVLLLLAASVICVGVFASNLIPRTSWYNDFARLTQFLPFD